MNAFSGSKLDARGTLLLFLFGLPLTVAFLSACTEESPEVQERATIGKEWEAIATSDFSGEELLATMAQYMASQESFSVRVTGGYDVLQDDGQKIQFVEARDITLARPDSMRIQRRGPTGEGETVLFDGSNITVHDSSHQVYAQVEQPGSVDDAVLYFVRELQLRLPLAPMLTTWLPQELERRARSIHYVESTYVFGALSHHIAVRLGSVDFQVWIADGEEPLPMRVVLTYPAEGRPQYWAQFSEWDLDPLWTADSFRMELPKESRQIPFAVQMPSVAMPPRQQLSSGE